MPSYLQRNRHGVYYFRRAIPKQIRHIIGKSEIIFSLHTRTTSDAKYLARLNAVRVDQYFLGAFMAKKDSEDFNLGFITKATLLDGTRVEHETTPTDIAAMKEAGLSPDQIADILKTVHTSPTDQQATLKDSPSSFKQTDVVSLSELIDQYVRHWEDEHAGSKLAAVQMTKLRRLTEILGKDTSIEQIDIDTAELVRSKIGKLPSNSVSYRGLKVPQILEIIADKNIECLSKKSQNDHLQIYSSLFKYACQKYRKAINVNPFEGVKVKVNAKEKIKKTRKAFTRKHLELIFSTPIHSEPNISMPYRYWAPLLGLFTGARRGSISAIHLRDIRKIDNIWVIDFNEDNEVKREKTASGFRITPIHPFLIKCGLLDYVKELEKKDEIRLLPDLKHWTEKELYGRAIGEWFNGSSRRRPGFLSKIGITGNKGEFVFHSFRHTITTELRRSGADNLQIEQICGRSEGSKNTGQLFYTEKDHPLDLYNTLSKVDFSQELKLVRPYYHIDKQSLRNK